MIDYVAKGRMLIIWVVLVAAIVYLGAVPFLPVSSAFIFYMMFWITMASSFNIIYGFTGYLPFGYVAFYGLGTYVTAVFWSRLGFPIPAAILIAGGAGVLLSLIFAPTLRLRGIYFAIVNFSCAMALRILIANLPEKWAGGSFGITLSAAYKPRFSYYCMFILMIVTIFIVWKLSISRLGIALRCIRDDYEAAEAMGINVSMCRLKAWMLAALIPSIAGGIEAWHTAIIDPDTSFSMMITTKSIVYAMFGGLGTITGPIVGAVFMYTLDDLIWARFPILNLMVLGIFIVALVLFFPRGIVGSITRWKPTLRAVLA